MKRSFVQSLKSRIVSFRNFWFDYFERFLLHRRLFSFIHWYLFSRISFAFRFQDNNCSGLCWLIMRLSHERSQHSINFNRLQLPSLSFHACSLQVFANSFLACLLTLVSAPQECFNILYENFYQFAFRSCDRMWNKLYCEFIMINLYYHFFFLSCLLCCSSFLLCYFWKI